MIISYYINKYGIYTAYCYTVYYSGQKIKLLQRSTM